MNNSKSFSPVKKRLICGSNSYIEPSAMIDSSGNTVTKNRVYIGHRVRILTHVHKIPLRSKTRLEISKDKDYTIPIDLIIEDEAWISQDVLILPQVRKIGKGAYIEVAAVVTKDIPPYEIWAGNPARKIGRRK